MRDYPENLTETDVIPGAVCYASGSNRAGEIAGLADIALPVGVTVSELGPEDLARLELEAGRILRLFVDSGAFGEVDRKNVLNVLRPISDAEWKTRLATYLRLARLYGSRMVAVAPDRVSCQTTTLARLSRYRREIREIAATGCGVLVPVQGGELSMEAFFKRACWALDLAPEDVIPAVPMKKGATPKEKVLEFVRAVRPARIHLLGMGRTNRSAPKFVAALEAEGVEVSMDACLITASVGKNNGRDNHPAEHRGCPRILTATAKYMGELSPFDRKRRSVRQSFSTEAMLGALPGTPRLRVIRSRWTNASDLPPLSPETEEDRERGRRQRVEWQRVRKTLPPASEAVRRLLETCGVHDA